MLKSDLRALEKNNYKMILIKKKTKNEKKLFRLKNKTN